MTMEQIIHEVAAWRGLSPDLLLAHNRKQEIADARHFATWLMLKMFNRSDVEAFFSKYNFHRSTHYHSAQKVDDLCSYDRKLREGLQNLLLDIVNRETTGQLRFVSC